MFLPFWSSIGLALVVLPGFGAGFSSCLVGIAECFVHWLWVVVVALMGFRGSCLDCCLALGVSVFRGFGMFFGWGGSLIRVCLGFSGCLLCVAWVGVVFAFWLSLVAFLGGFFVLCFAFCWVLDK